MADSDSLIEDELTPVSVLQFIPNNSTEVAKVGCFSYSLPTRRMVLLGLLLVLCGCSSERTATQNDAIATELFGPRAALIASLKDVTDLAAVHEGLPHPGVDSRFQTEEQRTDIFEFGEFLFYESAIPISSSDDKQLRSILADPTSYRRWSGEKLCDGFHPDWSIKWTANGTPITFLLCFGCHEIKVVFPDGELRFDITDDAYDELRKALRPHYKNLPKESR